MIIRFTGRRIVQLEVCLRSKALRVPVSPVFSKVMGP